MPNRVPPNGISVVLITAGATIVAGRNDFGWILVALGVVIAKRNSGG